MNHKEEQDSELEILRSIYPDELVEDEDGTLRIQIRLETELTGECTATLGVEMTPTYPEALPRLFVEWDQDEGNEERLQEGDDDLLKVELQLVAEESLGMAMIFTLASSLKESAEGLLQERLLQKTSAAEREAEERSQAEEAKREVGIPVTEQSFTAWWKESGRARMVEANSGLERSAMLPSGADRSGKLSGREILLQRRNLSREEMEDEDDGDGVDGLILDDQTLEENVHRITIEE